MFDMHGNVSEWCQGWYGQNDRDVNTKDPQGPLQGSIRVFRGGCWFYSGRFCWSSHRYGIVPSGRGFDLGFRVAAVPSSPAIPAEPAKNLAEPGAEAFGAGKGGAPAP